MDVNTLIGTRFNRLTVVGAGEKYRNGTQLLQCRCDCGGETRTSLPHLRRGEVKSCGCLSRERTQAQSGVCRVDMVGRIIGRLTVLSAAGQTKNGTFRWLCQCSCGHTKVVSGHLLRRGSTRSCGCLASEIVRKRNHAAGASDPWVPERNATRSQARYRKLAFDLDVPTYRALVSELCHYCGQPPSATPKNARLREMGAKVGGIDRIDSNVGYVMGNCVPCCGSCNAAKLDRTYEEFLKDTKRRYEHLRKQGLL